MRLADYYQQQCDLGVITEDQAQLAALDYFQVVCDELLSTRKKKWFKKFAPVRGLYIWGGVGIGKTYLMDVFYENVPIKDKMRLHFHAFMKMVHHEMQKYKGQEGPVRLVAKELAKEYKLICFDEFYVKEVVDAMILARLLEALLEFGVTFVATSNTAPDDLYKNGLQRISFLPAIDLINQHSNVLHLNSCKDYRLIQVKKSGVFFSPQDEVAEVNMQNLFSMLTHGYSVNEDPLNIHGRWINVRKRAENVVWFDFDDICKVPRSQQDYLSLVDTYDTFFVSGVPNIVKSNHNTIELFIKFIDVLYDKQVPLFLSSDIKIEEMTGELSHFPEYVRTHSRLMEMQSENYLAHRL